MILDSQIATGLASASLAVALTQTLGPHWMRPVTGHQYTEIGAEALAKVRDILAGPLGAALTPAERHDFWQEFLVAHSLKRKLDDEYKSLPRSLFVVQPGREFRESSQGLLEKVEGASNVALAQRAREQALEEEEMLLQRNRSLTSDAPVRPSISSGPMLPHPPPAYNYPQV